MFVFYILLVSICLGEFVPLGAELLMNLDPYPNELEPPRNVILIVAKGMSYDNILEARIKEAKETGSDNSHLLNFEKYLCYGILKISDDKFVGSSLTSASALFRGTYKLANSSCVRADSYEDETIIYSAQKENKSSGLVTTMRLTDPLPATLYGIGHNSGVSECTELTNMNCTDASHILMHGRISSGMDVIFGNGYGILGVVANDTDHKVTECERVDDRNLINEWKSAGPNRLYFGSAEEFSNHKINPGEKYLGTFLESELSETKKFTNIVIKAIQVLSSNKNGYFLVVIIDDLDTVKMILTLSKLIRRVRMVISQRDTVLMATSDYPKEQCHSEVVKDSSKNNVVSTNSEAGMKMPVAGEKNTTQQNNNSRSAKIRIMYPCNYSGSPSKNLHLPFYSSNTCSRPGIHIIDQATFGEMLMNLSSLKNLNFESDKAKVVEYFDDYYDYEDFPNLACPMHTVMFHLIFFAISHYFFL